MNTYIFFFYWIFSLFAFQMLSLFLFHLQKLPRSSLLLLLYESVPVYNHPQPPHYPGITLEYQPSQDHGPLLPLKPYKAIVCFICNQSHGFLHVYSLFGCLVPRSSESSGWLLCFSSYEVANPFSSFHPFSNTSMRKSMLNTMVVY